MNCRKSNILLYFSISFFLISCSASINVKLLNLKLNIDNGKYAEASGILTELELEYDNLSKEQKTELDIYKAYLKLRQGYSSLSLSILDNITDIGNKEMLYLIELQKGYYSINSNDIHNAILQEKSLHDSILLEIENNQELENKNYYLLISMYELIIESYISANDLTNSLFYLEECDGVFKELNKEDDIAFFIDYYSICIRLIEGKTVRFEEFKIILDTYELTPYWKIKIGIRAFETGYLSNTEGLRDFLLEILLITLENSQIKNTAQIQYMLGGIEKDNNYWEPAAEYFHKSADIFDQLNIESLYYRSYYQYGISIYKMAQYLEASAVFLKCEEYYKELDEKEIYANILSFSGFISRVLGNYKEAENYLLNALSIFDELGATVKISECYNNLAVVYYLELEYDRSYEYFNRAMVLLEQNEETNKEELAVIYNNIGNIKRITGHVEDALSLYNKGLLLCENTYEIKAEIYLNISRCYYLQNDLEAALSEIRKTSSAVNLKSSNIINAEIEYFKGRIYSDLQDYEQAYNSFNAAREYFMEYTDLKNQAKTCYSLAIVLINLDRELEAIEYLEEAAQINDAIGISVVGEDAETNYREEYSYVLEYLIKLLVEQGEYTRAFYYLEKTKARNLLESLSINSVNIENLIPEELLNERNYIIKLRNNLSKDLFMSGYSETVMNNIEQLDYQLKEIERQIELEVPYAYEIESAKVFSAEEIQNNLDDNEIILEYGIVQNDLYLFILTNNSITCRVLTQANKFLSEIFNDYNSTIKIEENADYYRDMIKEQYSLNSIRTVGKNLFETLLSPDYNDAVKRTNWIIIPDKKLYYLPFNALVNEDDNFLIEEDIYISYSHSSTVYITQKLKQNNLASKDFLFFALPDFSLYFGYGQDAEAIISYYNSPEYYFYTDAKESTLRTMDLTPYKTIQFLLHGFSFNDYSHFNSNGLLFNEDEYGSYDSRLILEEIFNLKMNPELLILTACSSGLGKDIYGEGLYGMNQAFFYAGARSILSTLWDVYVIETNRYSIILHDYITNYDYSPKMAVVMAQKKLYGESPHPVYWAPFVLFGYGGGVE